MYRYLYIINLVTTYVLSQNEIKLIYDNRSVLMNCLYCSRYSIYSYHMNKNFIQGYERIRMTYTLCINLTS